MARYIDADQLIDNLARLKDSCRAFGDYNNEFLCGTSTGINQAIMCAKAQPTADAVTKSEIVAEIIDDLAREGLLNVVPWAIAELKRKYREDINNEN